MPESSDVQPRADVSAAMDPQPEKSAPPSFGSTVTILFSDIRGFTEYTDAYGDASAYRMVRLHNSLLEEQFVLVEQNETPAPFVSNGPRARR
jgi:class 3 adenylate cyclase